MLSDEGDGARERVALIGIDVCGVDSVPDIGGLGHWPSVYLSVPKAFGTVPMINEGATAVEDVDRKGGYALAVYLERVISSLRGGEDVRRKETGFLKKENGFGGVVTTYLALSHQLDNDGIVVKRVAVLKQIARVGSVGQVPYAGGTAGTAVGKPNVATGIVVDILAAGMDAGLEISRDMKVHDNHTVGPASGGDKDSVAVVVGEENSIPNKGHIVRTDHGVEKSKLIAVDGKRVKDHAVAAMTVGSWK